jgi:acyl-CoA thioesterase I
MRAIAVLLCAVLVAIAAPAEAANECTIPDDLAAVDATLPHLRRALDAGQAVTIVAIGGGSTAGAAAGSPDLAYPHRLQQVLAEWYPKAAITVVNKGVPRQSAQQMLARFPHDVIAEKPVLVIWETGIADAVRGTPLDDYAGALQSGIDDLKKRGIDIVLVDMQFSHLLDIVVDFDRYLNGLHRIGDINDIYVFPRFEIMRYWSEQHIFNFDEVATGQRAKLAAHVYDCLGREMGLAIRRAIQ